MAQNPDWPRDSKAAEDLFPKKLNGFNNGRDTTEGVGGKVEPETPNLKQLFKPWGNYKDRTLLIYDNTSFKDREFLELCKKHQIRILPDLFSEIPDDKE